MSLFVQSGESEMNLKFWKAKEKKTIDVQYKDGIYYLGTAASDLTKWKLTNTIKAYRLSDAVYACVRLITQVAAGIPWYVYREKGEKRIEVTDHDLVDFMKRPSKLINTWAKFIEFGLGYFLISGNSYIRKMIGSFGKYGEAEILLPDRMDVSSDAQGMPKYRYSGGGRSTIIPPEEIIHIKTFNPENPLIGLSPIEPIVRSIDISTLNQLWTISWLENEAMIGGKIKGKNISEEMRKSIKNQLGQDYAGVLNAGKWLVLSGEEIDAERFASALKDLDNMPLEKGTLRKTCAIYNVPSELLGDSENKTYSNIKEARRSLYTEAVLPNLDIFKAELNSGLVPHFDKDRTIFLDYDVSDIEALSEDLDKLWDRALRATGSPFIDANEAREMLKYGRRKGLDTIYVPINYIPIAGSEKQEGKKQFRFSIKSIKDSGPGFWQKPERKERLWRSFDLLVKAKQKSLISIAESCLRKQVTEIKEKVSHAASIGQISPWSFFDKKIEAEIYLSKTFGWYAESFKKAVNAGMDISKGNLYDLNKKTDGGFWTPEQEEKLRKLIVHSGTKISEGTMEEILRAIEYAEEEMLTVEELTQYLYSHQLEMIPNRARRIARTETAKVENWGNLEGFHQSEFIEDKGWVCSFVELSRAAHMAADREYSANPIPLDSPFIVDGEELIYPGDPQGSPGNIINCLCVVFPHIKER